MDLNLMRAVVTALGLAVFLGLVAWAWSRQRRAAFDAAAQLPFLDSEIETNKGVTR